MTNTLSIQSSISNYIPREYICRTSMLEKPCPHPQLKTTLEGGWGLHSQSTIHADPRSCVGRSYILRLLSFYSYKEARHYHPLIPMHSDAVPAKVYACTPFPYACNACHCKYVESSREKQICNLMDTRGLCEAKVLATSRHGGVEGFPKVFVRFVLGKVEFCEHISGLLI
jgi:hypothetical protein